MFRSYGYCILLRASSISGNRMLPNDRYAISAASPPRKQRSWFWTRYGWSAAAQRLDSGGVRKKGLNREIHAASPAAFLKMTRTKAEEAGSWYEEAPTREIKLAQRCHVCRALLRGWKRDWPVYPAPGGNHPRCGAADVSP